MGRDGVDVIFKDVTLDELDDVSNLNLSTWSWLIPQSFSGIFILDVGLTNIIQNCVRKSCPMDGCFKEDNFLAGMFGKKIYLFVIAHIISQEEIYKIND